MTQPMNQENQLPHLVFLGALRSAAGFPFEHPLELMKIEAQKHPQYSSGQVIDSIIKERGILGFSNTILPNFPRRILREAVRWPVIAYANEQLRKKFPGSFTKEGTADKVATGIALAIFNASIVLPFENLIAYRVKEQKSYASFFKERGIRSLHRGFAVDLVYQSVLWSTFMSINHESKKAFDLWDKDKAHPYLRQGVTSVLIAVGINITALPINFVKTQIQMHKDLQEMKVSYVVQTLVRRHSFSGFYAGALPVFIHSVFHATLGGYILDKIFYSFK